MISITGSTEAAPASPTSAPSIKRICQELGEVGDVILRLPTCPRPSPPASPA